MATVEQCRTALESLAGQLGRDGSAQRAAGGLERTVSATLHDLGITFVGNLRGDKLEDVTTEPAARAQIRLAMSSDDLVALSDGSLAFPGAWASGRVKVEASIFDLMKLRSLL